MTIAVIAPTIFTLPQDFLLEDPRSIFARIRLLVDRKVVGLATKLDTSTHGAQPYDRSLRKAKLGLGRWTNETGSRGFGIL